LLKEFPTLEMVHSMNIELNIAEGNIAKILSDFQDLYPEIEMGSYPFQKNDIWGTNIVFRGFDKSLMKNIIKQFKSKIGV